MPPDALNAQRLQKVLGALDAEAKQLKPEELDPVKLSKSRLLDTQSEPKSNADDGLFSGGRSETVVSFKSLQYVDNGAYDLVWTRIAYFSTWQLLHLWAIVSVFVWGTTTTLKTCIFGGYCVIVTRD